MPNAMIFDAVRTPRGKGKKDGSLHEVKPVDLLAGLLVKLPSFLPLPRGVRTASKIIALGMVGPPIDI